MFGGDKGLGMYPRSCASLAAIAHHAELIPHSPALISTNGITLDYGELWAQVLAVGRRLESAGISPQETVAVLLPQGARQILAVAGVLDYCTCAPLQPRTTAAEVEAFLSRLAASAIIVSPEFEAEAEAASSMGLTVLIARDEESPTDWQIRRAASPRQVRAASSDAILLMATSATSGAAKVVPLTAENLDAQTTPRSNSLRLTSSDRMLQMTSLCHGMGIENTLAQFLVGGTVIATDGFEPIAYTQWLRDLRPTWYDCAPTVHQAVLAQLKREPLEIRILSPFRTVRRSTASQRG